MMIGKTSLVCLAAAIGQAAAQLTYPSPPSVNWATTLSGGLGQFGFPTLGPMNAVTPDEANNQVYATVDNGRFVVLNAQDGSPRFDFTPEPRDVGWLTRCDAGVAFGSNDLGDFVLYPVIDIAPLSAQSDDMSRIFVFSRPSNELLFVAENITGTIIGTPVVSRNPVQQGAYIYFTHNLNARTDTPVGVFSIVLASAVQGGGEPGDIFFSEIAGENPADPTLTRLDSPAVAYGPPGLGPFPTNPRFPGADNNSNEFLIWGTSINGGQFGTGYTRAFQFPIGFDGMSSDGLATTFLREVRWNHIAPPYISDDGQTLIFGASRNIIRGWTGVPTFDETGNLSPNFGAEMQPAIPYTVNVNSQNGNLAFVTTTGIMYYISSSGGAGQMTFWQYPGPGDAPLEYSSPAFLSQLGQFAYSSTVDGTVLAVSTADGSLYWSIDCAFIQAAITDAECSGSIQANIGITENGARLFVGDTGGNIFSIQVAEGADTFAPVPFPPSGSDTMAPSPAPVDAPTMPPMDAPLDAPMMAPVDAPVEAPMMAPVDAPVEAPMMAPMEAPAEAPTSSAGTATMSVLVGLLAIAFHF